MWGVFDKKIILIEKFFHVDLWTKTFVVLNKLTKSFLIRYLRYFMGPSICYIFVFNFWDSVAFFCILSFKGIELRLHPEIGLIVLTVVTWLFEFIELRFEEIFLQLWCWVVSLCFAFKWVLNIISFLFLFWFIFDLKLDLFLIDFNDSFPTFSIVYFGSWIVALPTLTIHTTYSFVLSGRALILFAMYLWRTGRLSILIAFCFYCRSIVFG